MVLSHFEKLSEVVAKILEWIFTIVINAVVAPLSLLYSLTTKTLGSAWKMVDIPGIYYFWWSNRDKIIKYSNEDASVSSALSKIKGNPRVLLLLFALAVIPMIIAAAVKLLVRSWCPDNKDTGNIQDAEITQEPPELKLKRKPRKSSK